MYHGFNDTSAITKFRLKSVAPLGIDSSQHHEVLLSDHIYKNGEWITHGDTWALGGFLVCSQSSRYVPSCSRYDQEDRKSVV